MISNIAASLQHFAKEKLRIRLLIEKIEKTKAFWQAKYGHLTPQVRLDIDLVEKLRVATQLTTATATFISYSSSQEFVDRCTMMLESKKKGRKGTKSKASTKRKTGKKEKLENSMAIKEEDQKEEEEKKFESEAESEGKRRCVESKVDSDPGTTSSSSSSSETAAAEESTNVSAAPQGSAADGIAPPELPLVVAVVPADSEGNKAPEEEMKPNRDARPSSIVVKKSSANDDPPMPVDEEKKPSYSAPQTSSDSDDGDEEQQEEEEEEEEKDGAGDSSLAEEKKEESLESILLSQSNVEDVKHMQVFGLLKKLEVLLVEWRRTKVIEGRPEIIEIEPDRKVSLPMRR